MLSLLRFFFVRLLRELLERELFEREARADFRDDLTLR
jgi:hypothetical protein